MHDLGGFVEDSFPSDSSMVGEASAGYIRSNGGGHFPSLNGCTVHWLPVLVEKILLIEDVRSCRSVTNFLPAWLSAPHTKA